MVFIPAVIPPAVGSVRARWFLVQRGGLLVRAEGPSVALPLLSDVCELGLDPALCHYLGRIDGDDCFALDAAELTAPAPWSVQGLRSLYGQLDEEAFAVAGRALQVVNFAVTHRYCGRCGSPTRLDGAERCVRCAGCDLTFYPRISPAIIVLVRRADQALLARSARFTSGFYSTLAGFVEPGESLEETLAREVREEAGVEVADIRYFGSQPWPFPHSLMVGFVAEHAGGEIQVDGVEIVDARWFSPTELPPVPPKLSIARQLIDAWVEEVTKRS
jgi:NAD+ diphosphatase